MNDIERFNIPPLSTDRTVTPQEAAEYMEHIVATLSHDKEAAHMAGDNVMMHILNQLGYKDAVKAFFEMEKWHA